MKAIIQMGYGPPETLDLRDIPKPTPASDEVLVAVRASCVNFNTLAFVTGKPFPVRMWTGLRKPGIVIPGNDIAGHVESVGSDVRQLHPGDDVFGDLADCGYGAYAEYVSVPEGALVPKPFNLSYEEAAAAPQAAVVALQALRDAGKIQPAQKVLIYGASGGIGTYAVQIAKSFGAEVTGVCSTRNLDMVRSLGADHVIDYTEEDFTKNGEHYDLILATAGYRSILDYRRALATNGRYVATGGSMRGPKAMSQILQAVLLGRFISQIGGKKMGNWHLNVNPHDLLAMKELFESGKVKSVIDRRYPLSKAAEALAYYSEGHTRGKIVITVQ